MKKDSITIDELAIMVQNGFEDVKKVLRGEMKEGFDRVDARFDKIETRQERIENIVLNDHTKRICRLEDKLAHI